VTLFMGCKKYHDDKYTIHLQSVEKRLTRNWCRQGYANDCNGDIVFSKNGDFTSQFNSGPFGHFPITGEKQATWELIDHKNKVRINNPNDNKSYDFTIERLEKISGWHVLELKNDSATLYFDESRG